MQMRGIRSPRVGWGASHYAAFYTVGIACAFLGQSWMHGILQPSMRLPIERFERNDVPETPKG